jgi:opacity protein-like surface antigen
MLALALALTAPAGAGAQSLQKISLQGSGAVLFATRKDPTYESKTRLGWEAQARYTFGRWSLGAGYQRSTVFAFTEGQPPPTLALSFGFIEPRVVLVARRGVALYLAGRFGAGKLTSAAPDFNIEGTNIGYGGGGGLLVRLSNRLSADLGGQYFDVRGDLPSGYAMIRAGLGFGL